MPQASDKEQARTKLQEYRRIVANVVGELRSQEIRDTYAALTFSELIEQQIVFLEGDGIKLGRKQRLEKMYEEFDAALAAIKATPPSAFRVPDPTEDVNTKEDPEETDEAAESP